MNLEYIGANIFINSNSKKIGDKKEEKMVELATKMMIDHPWLGVEDSKCGCDDEYEYYTQLTYDFEDVSRKDISEEFKIIKKEVTRQAA